LKFRIIIIIIIIELCVVYTVSYYYDDGQFVLDSSVKLLSILSILLHRTTQNPQHKFL